jgi:hypothetical protein
MQKFLIGLFILVSGMVSSQSIKTLENDKENFILEYPSDWLVRNLEQYEVLISEPAGTELTFMSTFDIQIDYKTKNVKTYCKNYEAIMRKSESFKKFKIKAKKMIDFKGFDAIEYHCTATSLSIPLEWRSIIFIKNDKIFKLTTTSMVGKFLDLKQKTDKIFESFEIE